MGKAALSAARNRRTSETVPPSSRGASCVWTCWSPTFADSEPRRGPFGPLGVLDPRPPRAGLWGREL
eukprot:13031067-Alexandrium_andersonii.AAC.1